MKWNWKMFFTVFGICMMPWIFTLGIELKIRKTTADILKSREQVLRSPFIKK